jgi:alcohol dehydrogenase, propanol-preferring
MMKALRLVDWQHDPEVQEVPRPEPGPGEVVVKVGGAGLCHSDLHILHDFEPGMMPWQIPFTLGHENAGWIDSLGAGVTGWEIGQPVAVYGFWSCGRCYRCQQGLDNFCENTAAMPGFGGGLGLDGGMAGYMRVPSDRLLVPLENLSPAEAAPLTDAALTPYRAVRRSIPILVPGSTAVIIGAGGLGHLAIQILKHLTPARVVVVDKSQAALELAATVGADAGIGAGDDAVQQIRDITGGRGAEATIDLVGAESTLKLAADVAQALGHVTLVGVGPGTYPFGFFTAPYEVAFANSNWGTIGELIEVLRLAEAGHLKVHIQRFTLDTAMDGYNALQNGDLVGRGVVIPDAE